MGRLSALMAVVAGVIAVAGMPAAAATWVSYGPGPPIVQTVAFDPTQPGVAYAGTAGGHLLRSRDGGATWQFLAAFGDYSIRDIAARGQRLLIGTEGNVRRSLDGGATWQRAGAMHGLRGYDVRAVAIDPHAPDVMLAGTRDGLFRSGNAGGHWYYVPTTTGTVIEDILFDPSQPGVTYVATNQGVSRSQDHGVEFAAYNQGPGAANIVYALALADTTLYAAGSSGAMRTPTGPPPATWSKVNDGFTLEGFPYTPNLQEIVVTGARLLAIDPGTMYASELDPVNWSDVARPVAFLYALAADQLSPMRVLAVGDGIARSLDGGVTWQRVDRGILGLGVERVVPTSARSALLVSYTGLLRTDDLGASFSATNSGMTGFLVGMPAVAPDDPSHVLMFTTDSLFGSTDGGRTWTPRSYGGYNFSGRIAFAPSDPSIVYAAGFDLGGGAVKRSADGGHTWDDAGSAEADFQFANGITVDPADPNRVYLATDVGVRLTSDGGQRWAAAGDLPAGDAAGVAIDPRAPANVYAIAGGALWRSTDRGVRWKVLPAPPAGAVSDVVLDPLDPATLYVATSDGVFRSADRGASWQPFSDGLPSRRVNDLAFDRERLALYAATEGGLAVLAFPAPLPPPPPPPPPPSPRALPAVARRITVNRRGVARVTLSCPARATGGCAGTLRLTRTVKVAVKRRGARGRARTRTRQVVLASRRFSLRGGERRTLSVKLRGVRVRAGARVRATARLAATGFRARAVGVTLVGPKARARRPARRGAAR